MDESSFSGGLNQTDWLCLSFLSGIGPARLSRLYTFLHQLHQLDSESSAESLCIDSSAESLCIDIATANSRSAITYDLLRKLNWPEITARQAMDYLSSGRLSDEQMEKRDQTLDWLSASNHHLLLQQHAYYPNALKEITVAPAFLYAEGDLAPLLLPKLGIVGARKCTDYGRDITSQFAQQLAARGICVVSGGALGIDTAAHQGALQEACTPTLAVMGTGLQHRYPSRNVALFDQIIFQGGLLVSEYPLMTSARPNLFPPRNRIISGLSMGVLVVEASVKSGSLISANYAVQQNREVFAVPGRLSDALAEGCHQLIRQGATLVRHIDDILSECPEESLQGVLKVNIEQPIELLQPSVSSNPSAMPIKTVSQGVKKPVSELPSTTSDEARAVATLLERESRPIDFDALIRHTKIHADIMMQALMELELSGCIENRHGAYLRC